MKQHYIHLLLKTVLFMSLFFIIDFLIGVLFKTLEEKAFQNNENASEMAFRYCVERATPQIAIIGSSTASHHYIPDVIEDSLGMSVYNFGKDGCFFLYQNAEINLMLERYKPDCILWEIGETSLSSKYDKEREYQGIKDLYPFYKHPYVKSIIDGADQFQFLRMLINSYKYNSNVLALIRLCVSDCQDSQKGYMPLYNSMDPSSRQEKAGFDYVTEQSKVDRLQKTIERCNNSGVQLIFVSSPRYNPLNVASLDCYNRLRTIARQNNIPFIDFYDNPQFSYNTVLFSDCDHMNNEGAELYMSLLIPKISRIINNKKQSPCFIINTEKF